MDKADNDHRTLTERDLELLDEMMGKHNVCALHLNPDVAKVLNKFSAEQLGILHRVLIISGKAANITGTVVLVAIVGGVIAIFSRGYWATIIQGIKKVGTP